MKCLFLPTTRNCFQVRRQPPLLATGMTASCHHTAAGRVGSAKVWPRDRCGGAVSELLALSCIRTGGENTLWSGWLSCERALQGLAQHTVTLAGHKSLDLFSSADFFFFFSWLNGSCLSKRKNTSWQTSNAFFEVFPSLWSENNAR